MTERDTSAHDPTADSEQEPRRALRSMLVTFLAAALVVVLAGVGGWAMRHDGSLQHQPATGGFMLSTLSGKMTSHYHFADAHPSMYEQVPCFCGCDQMLGHRSLLDCFVKADGSGWEAHASGCDVCIRESEMVRRMLDHGIPPDQIADTIVAHYGGDITAT
jgi:Protein of unknown function with PCYCGC motif